MSDLSIEDGRRRNGDRVESVQISERPNETLHTAFHADGCPVFDLLYNELKICTSILASIRFGREDVDVEAIHEEGPSFAEQAEACLHVGPNLPQRLAVGGNRVLSMPGIQTLRGRGR